MRTIFELVPVIADIIAAHCPHTAARRNFMRACIHEDWQEAKGMVQGMLAEPWLLRGYQETRLREFLELLPGTERALIVRRSGSRCGSRDLLPMVLHRLLATAHFQASSLDELRAPFRYNADATGQALESAD